jgi:hypothetical protein
MKANFLCIELCDNDFGHELETAARLMREHLDREELPVGAARLKGVAVDLVVGLSNLREAARGWDATTPRTREYLERRLNVVLSNEAPTKDHDGGSVAWDRSTNYIWRY